MRRHIINSPDQVVPHALEGLEICFPDLVRYVPEPGYVCRAVPARSKVGVVSGGGSGHEPLHAGFVGRGMLDVAVPGAVFASPTALQVHEGTVAADSGRGVVQIVKNYTGDVLNFTIARELAGDNAVATRMVLVDDDEPGVSTYYLARKWPFDAANPPGTKLRSSHSARIVVALDGPTDHSRQ